MLSSTPSDRPIISPEVPLLHAPIPFSHMTLALTPFLQWTGLLYRRGALLSMGVLII